MSKRDSHLATLLLGRQNVNIGFQTSKEPALTFEPTMLSILHPSLKNRGSDELTLSGSFAKILARWASHVKCGEVHSLIFDITFTAFYAVKREMGWREAPEERHLYSSQAPIIPEPQRGGIFR